MSSRLLMTRVLLRDTAMPDATRIVELLGEIRPKLGPVAMLEQSGNNVILSLDGRKAALSLTPEPMGREELAKAASAAWYWPEAALVLRDHQAQLLVGTEVETGDRIEGAMALTSLSAAAGTTAAALGIQWTAASLLHPTDAFATYARQMSREQLPLYLWVDFHVYRDPDGTFSLVTRGLEAFGSLEIEVAQSPSDPPSLIGRVYDIAHFVLEKGVLLRDGETIGFTQDERIPIAVGPSRENLDRQAIHIQL